MRNWGIVEPLRYFDWLCVIRRSVRRAWKRGEDGACVREDCGCAGGERVRGVEGRLERALFVMILFTNME